jgi:hypothetical protein
MPITYLHMGLEWRKVFTYPIEVVDREDPIGYSSRYDEWKF